MDFDSPDVAKEFPGLYMGDAGRTLNDPAECKGEDEKAKRRKEKKEGKKEKGYAALAGESSPEEEEADPKSPGKTKKIKASFKLSSAKKKDKKSFDKTEKEKVAKKTEKEKEEEKKPAEKDKKALERDKHSLEKDKDKKVTEKEKEKEKKSAEKDKDKKLEKDKEKKLEKEKKKEEKKKKASLGDCANISVNNVAATASPSTVEKERGLNLNQALNAFLNAPAPRLMKKDKDKESKKHKEGSTSSKVKLKLKRSKNSLDEQSSQSDIPFSVSHQFPEEPEAITKEIKKYEALLEQTHSHMKSSKKVSKKSEEQLWELQRTLTQLKRKLRSLNALSVTTSANVMANITQANNVPVPTALLPESQRKSSASFQESPPTTKESILPAPDRVDGLIPVPPAAVSPIKYDTIPEVTSPLDKKSPPEMDMALDFTRMDAISSIPIAVIKPADVISPTSPPSVSNGNPSAFREEIDFKQPIPPPEAFLDPHQITDFRSDSSNFASISPEAEIEKVQVEVQVHAMSISPIFQDAEGEFYPDGSVTPDSHIGSPAGQHLFKALTFSEDEEEDDDVDDVTDISTLSLRNNYPDSENVSVRDKAIDSLSEFRVKAFDDKKVENVNPFEMAIFETDEYLSIENEALISFNEGLQLEIAKEEAEIEDLMDQLEEMGNEGVDIDAPEIELDLDQFDSDELLSLWQITKLENEALNDRVHQLRQLVATSKLEEFRLETRVKYLEDLHLKFGTRIASP